MAVDTAKTMLSRSRELLDRYGDNRKHDMDTYRIMDALWQTMFQMYVEGQNGQPQLAAMSLNDMMQMAHEAGLNRTKDKGKHEDDDVPPSIKRARKNEYL